ncbi:MAG: hypothetical protein IKM73_13865 [Acidaminococcaceae bacterium]|nr:hypothetical protein [Acidaminococcaceae bacterium]
MYSANRSTARRREDAQAEHGYVTIEAMISFLAFLFIIFTILNVMNYCRVEALISNAVDTAAKELSQYSYFYEMSGLDKYKKGVEQNAEFGRENINQVISIVNGLYTNVSKTVNDGVQAGQEAWEDLENSKDPTPTIEGALTTLEGNVYAVEGSIHAIMAAFEGAADNPLMYVKSLVAVAGKLGLDLVVSHVIAAPLAKVFMTKHFGSNRQEADAYLERLGVVDGLDGMNFTMSTLFSKDEADGKLVHLAVYYNIKVPAILKWAELELPVCKEAITYAWLGGDSVSARVKPKFTPKGSADGGETPPTLEEMETPEQTEPPTETEPPEQTEIPTETEPPVDLTGSYWTGDPVEQQIMFRDAVLKTYLRGEGAEIIVSEFNELIGKTDKLAVGETHLVSANNPEKILRELDAGVRQLEAMEQLWTETNGEQGWEPGTTNSYLLVVYIPENIPPDQKELLEQRVQEYEQSYLLQYAQTRGKAPAWLPQIHVKSAGGNYDYGSETTP